MDDPDYWLRYELAAVVGPDATVQSVAQALRVASNDARAAPVASLEAGLALVPVTAELAARLSADALRARNLGQLSGRDPAAALRRQHLAGPESGFLRLTPAIVALVEAVSVLGTLAYIEADYIGLEGRQAAALWESGQLIMGPRLLGRREPFDPPGAPITVALRGLGVENRGRRDAFLVAGLDRYRTTEQWLDADIVVEPRDGA